MAIITCEHPNLWYRDTARPIKRSISKILAKFYSSYFYLAIYLAKILSIYLGVLQQTSQISLSIHVCSFSMRGRSSSSSSTSPSAAHVHVRRAPRDLHRRLVAPALALDCGRHDEPAVVPQRPVDEVAAAPQAAPWHAVPAERLGCGEVNGELAALGRGDGGLGEGTTWSTSGRRRSKW